MKRFCLFTHPSNHPIHFYQSIHPFLSPFACFASLLHSLFLLRFVVSLLSFINAFSPSSIYSLMYSLTYRFIQILIVSSIYLCLSPFRPAFISLCASFSFLRFHQPLPNFFFFFSIFVFFIISSSFIFASSHHLWSRR